MGKKLKYQTIIKPIITEKTLKLVDELNKYTFQVDKRANKESIKKAVEEMFKVTAVKVSVQNVSGKSVSWGRKRISGRRGDWKKAVVTLKSSDSIDLFKVK